jgi:hypothetical protein
MSIGDRRRPVSRAGVDRSGHGAALGSRTVLTAVAGSTRTVLTAVAGSTRAGRWPVESSQAYR